MLLQLGVLDRIRKRGSVIACPIFIFSQRPCSWSVAKTCDCPGRRVLGQLLNLGACYIAGSGAEGAPLLLSPKARMAGFKLCPEERSSGSTGRKATVSS